MSGLTVIIILSIYFLVALVMGRIVMLDRRDDAWATMVGLLWPAILAYSIVRIPLRYIIRGVDWCIITVRRKINYSPRPSP